MKKILLFTLLISLLFISSCDWFDSPTDSSKPNATELRNAYEVVLEVNAVKQSKIYDVVKAFSNDYNSKFLEKDLTYKQIDAVYENLFYTVKYKGDIDKALNTIEKSDESMFFKDKLPNKYNSEQLQGIGSAMKGFFDWCAGTGKNSRTRILTVSSNLSAEDRTKLYDGLRPNWKEKVNSQQDFWNKLEKGELDNSAPQMFNDFAHTDNTDFPLVALDKGLSIQKIVVKEGAEGITAGASVIVETVKIITPLGKGMDLVDKAKDYAERGEKIFTDPKGALKDEIKTAISKKIGGFIDIDGLTNAAGISEAVSTALKAILDAGLGSDEPDKWIQSAINWGLGKIVDTDQKGKSADIVVAENMGSNTVPHIVISVGETKVGDNSEIKIGLPEGTWKIKVIDIEGIWDEVITEIQSKIETLILTSTDKDGQHQKGAYSLSVWISPANPDALQSVTVYAKIYPATAGKEIYFSISGTDAYHNEIKSKTDAAGQTTFHVPGGAEGVVDNLIIRIEETGLTRTLSYVF